MKLVIAGLGYVGKAHHFWFSKKVEELVAADPAINELNVADVIEGADGLICCVSTPEASDGSCNISNIESVINQTPSNVQIIIRSTISIEGWESLKKNYRNHKLTYCPEFLRAAKWESDFMINQQLWMGGEARNIQFWHDVFIKVLEHLTVGVVDPKVLIAGKNFRNSFLATKVAFFNQIYDYCQAKGIDYGQTAEMICVDPRIGGSHTAITKERGFGGHCFPKDTQAIVKSAEKDSVELSIIKEAIAYNKLIRNSNT